MFAIQWENDSNCDPEFCFSSRIEAETYLYNKSSEYQGVVIPLYRSQHINCNIDRNMVAK